MKKYILIALALVCLYSSFAQNNAKTLNTFTLGEKTFLLNGQPYLIRAGEIHFPRIPREYWEHRIQMCKAMGMNTICIYLFWNFHEQTPGNFDFTGQKDVAEFVRLVQKNGMYAIVRPGPYACAEWDMGGLPWWLLKKKDLQVRTRHDAYFMERAKNYLKEVGKQLAPLQIQNGGNIIMVQVENEYAVFGDDAVYMTEMRDAITDAGFDKVQLFRCDWSSTFHKYDVANVATTLNFGAGSKIDEQFARFQELYPTAPLMCSEYWTGWFDYWGRPHETRSVESFIGSLKDMMDRKISFSLYMAHGGTSFGQWGGANSPPFGCMVASYDYNAPINEAGQTTDKFFAVRDLLKNHLNEGEILPEIPKPYPVIEIPEFDLSSTAALFDNLPQSKFSESIQPMEMFDQGWGQILYRTNIPKDLKDATIRIDEVHDWAMVYIDGKLIGKLDRRKNETELNLISIKKGQQLDILVEAMGRVNYGETILDRKGITQKVELISPSDTLELKGWKVFNLDVDYQKTSKVQFTKAKVNGPAWYKGSFKVSKTGDSFLDMSNWGKGMVWVNGYNLGRFWNLGPQQTLFVPGCWLKNGDNDVVVLDFENPGTKTLKGISQPILDVIKPDASLLSRKPGQALDLTAEKPVISGTLAAGSDWKTISLPMATEARYFCFEALSSQKPDDVFTSIAEIEAIDVNGKPVSKANWKVIYADSEEIVAGNHSAAKVFDNQESIFWHTAWVAQKTGHPHHIVIDMGDIRKIKGFRLLQRTDKSDLGNVKDFRFYAKTSPFILKGQ